MAKFIIVLSIYPGRNAGTMFKRIRQNFRWLQNEKGIRDAYKEIKEDVKDGPMKVVIILQPDEGEYEGIPLSFDN